MYDTIIIGGGPAGITAGIYLARKKVRTLLITSDFIGQVGLSGQIENWPGTLSVKGSELIGLFEGQLRQQHIDIIEEDVQRTMVEKDAFTIETDETSYRARTLLLATGSTHKKLDVPGESTYIGKGVVYCTTCDAPVYQDKKVVVVGGGNAGFASAIELSDYTSDVTLIEVTDSMSADELLQDRAMQRGVRTIKNKTITKIDGGDYLDKIFLSDDSEMSVDGVFIQIGYTPNSRCAPTELQKNDAQEIIINPQTCATNVDGCFAAGDVTDIKDKQIVTAAGEGAKAALSIYAYLQS